MRSSIKCYKFVSMSDIVLFHSAGSFRCSLIIKRQIPNLTRRQLFNCDQAFNNEINAYVHVVPKLLNFANRSGLRIPLARCLFAGVDDNGEIIMLEDLKPLGYKMANRIKGLDYSHCKIVLQVIFISPFLIIIYN